MDMSAKSVKIFAAALLAGALACGALAGCSGGNASSGAASGGASGASATYTDTTEGKIVSKATENIANENVKVAHVMLTSDYMVDVDDMNSSANVDLEWAQDGAKPSKDDMEKAAKATAQAVQEQSPTTTHVMVFCTVMGTSDYGSFDYMVNDGQLEQLNVNWSDSFGGDSAQAASSGAAAPSEAAAPSSTAASSAAASN